MQPAAAGRRAGARKILAPIFAGFVPCNPDASAAIPRYAGVKLRFRLGGDRDQFAELASIERAQVDIVVAGPVTVPGDPCRAVRVERDRGLPIVARARRDARLRAPAIVRKPARVTLSA